MVLNQITYFSIFGIPLIAYGGIITFGFLIATVYTGMKNKKIETHTLLAKITSILALIHGLLGVLSYF